MVFQFVSYPAVISGSGGSTLGTPTQAFGGAGGTIVGAINNVNVAYTLPTAPTSVGALEVYLDGLFQRQGAGQDYTIAGSVITFAIAPNFGQFVDAFYFQ